MTRPSARFLASRTIIQLAHLRKQPDHALSGGKSVYHHYRTNQTVAIPTIP